MSQTHLLFGLFLGSFREPIREEQPHGELAYAHAIEAGVPYYAAGALWVVVRSMCLAGERLPQLLEKAIEHRSIVEKLVPRNTAYYDIVEGYVRALRGETARPTSLSRPGFSEAGFVREVMTNHVVTAPMLYFLCTSKVKLHLLFDEPETALEFVDGAAGLAHSIAGMAQAIELTFWRALVCARLLDAPLPAQRRAALGAQLQDHAAALARHAARCPQNFLHMHLLVGAEIARLEGRVAEALLEYERASAEAAREGFSPHEALAYERAATLCERAGLPDGWRGRLERARAAYEAWGASTKVEQLQAALSRRPSPLVRTNERGARIAIAGNVEASAQEETERATRQRDDDGAATSARLRHPASPLDLETAETVKLLRTARIEPRPGLAEVRIDDAPTALGDPAFPPGATTALRDPAFPPDATTAPGATAAPEDAPRPWPTHLPTASRDD